MIISKLNKYLNFHSNSNINYVIADYMKNHIQELPMMTIDEVANHCFVSRAKISNFCKELGYENFTHLNDDCRNEAKKKQDLIQAHATSSEFVKEQITRSLNRVSDTLCKLDFQMIDQLVSDIYHCDHIYLYGISYNHLLCAYLQQEFDYLGKAVVVLDEGVSELPSVTEHSMLLVFSISGYTIQQNRVVKSLVQSAKINSYMITTVRCKKEILHLFHHAVVLETNDLKQRDIQIAFRYLLDILLSQYQHEYVSK